MGKNFFLKVKMRYLHCSRHLTIAVSGTVILNE